jgi:hypothetical protein
VKRVEAKEKGLSKRSVTLKGTTEPRDMDKQLSLAVEAYGRQHQKKDVWIFVPTMKKGGAVIYEGGKWCSKTLDRIPVLQEQNFNNINTHYTMQMQ